MHIGGYLCIYVIYAHMYIQEPDVQGRPTLLDLEGRERERERGGGGEDLLPGALLRLSIFDQMQELRGRRLGMRRPGRECCVI